ncbi:MAG: pyridoxal phosphate-dependent aminotransferase [Candidatus Peribacteraceae bacterium]|nr:pyridoxal phosphate-dependent aminotransferase [Candidatus Peribacteraceae bacterium]
MMLTQNEFGFDLATDNPFVIFRLLAKIAREAVGVDKVLDLSRGDPGYGFAPNVRSRKFYAFLVALDTVLNNFETHFKDRTKDSETEILNEIEQFAKKNYAEEVATELLADFDEFLNKVIEAAKRQGLDWGKFEVLFELFKYATVSGGCYHDPYGELLSRVVVADYHSKNLGVDVKYSDLVFTNGASHAIGTFFKAFGAEGGGLLKPGDEVMITSPVYFPYMGIMEARGLKITCVSADPATGQFAPDAFEKVADSNPKVIVLVDPDNPTGLVKNEESLKMLAEFAEQKDAIILSDEVYSAFHPGKKSILEFAPKRTIRIDARSKIERATGCRFGEYIVTDVANEFISKKWEEFLPKGLDVKTYLHDAKAPGGVLGEFRHTTFVPGPSQILGICHILLGDKERAKYRDIVQENMNVWSENLGIENPGNFYYSLVDLNSIASEAKKSVPAEQKFLDLAKLGVVLIPSNLFFSKEDREAEDRKNFARASLPNLTTAQVKSAAKIIREYLTN